MKTCPECGAQVEDNVRFCTNCGASMADAVEKDEEAAEEVAETVEEVKETVEAPAVEPLEVEETSAPKVDAAPIVPISSSDDHSSGSSYSAPNVRAGVGTDRNIVVCIILTFITCGIYGLYWMYMLNKEINELAGEKEYTDGVLVIVFCIITCGIYGFFWNFKMGEQVDKINGNPDGNYNIIFLILSIFELAIVNHAIMQDTINKAIRHG